jgi:uncharacterized membrane protein
LPFRRLRNDGPVRPKYLLHGLPGHPVHPPLTDVTIGSYVFATIAGCLSAAGFAGDATAKAWWLGLIVALCWTALTATTGLIDWLQIERGSAIWWTATWHALANATAGALFGVAAIYGYAPGWHGGAVTTLTLVLTLCGAGVLFLGGWLGGTVVFVHGMRVLNLAEEPPQRAAAPVATEEKEEASVI